MNFLIAISILIFFIAFKIYQRATKVPEGLENVPTLNFLEFLVAIYNKEGPDKRWESTRDIVEKEGIAKVLFFMRFNIKESFLKKKKNLNSSGSVQNG